MIGGEIMRCIINRNEDVFFNFAVEEYFIENYQEPIFILWKNQPNVMVGRNQNTYAEVNEEFCKQNRIKVVRRLSGGGAVYSSPENFQYTLILNKNNHKDISFESLAKPLIAFLKKYDIDAEFTGRNDILIDGKKISGNAQYHHKDILLHHGTILFDVNIDHLTKSLTPDLEKITAKGIKSIRSRITTIKEHLSKPMTVGLFIEKFMNFQLESSEENYYKDLTLDEIDGIEEIMENRWIQWEWNYGKNPKFEQVKKQKFPFGLVEVAFTVKKGRIDGLKIYGDFFGEESIQLLEEAFIGIQFDEASVDDVLKEIKVSRFINGMTSKDFKGLFLK